MISDKKYDYIIIGSGFGGSVAAMRLSEKGYKVLVLEKGKKYEAKDFPKTNWNLKKYLWVPGLRWFGFLKLSMFKKLFVVSGVGVGGGSLVYANTLMEPLDPFYQHIPLQSKNWKNVLRPCFEKAKYMLGVTLARHHYADDALLKEIATDMGQAETYKGVQVGVFYSENATPRDPYFNGKGPLRTPCIECAGCMVGCRYNAKNTLDKNYLWFAEKSGAEIEAETEVIKLSLDENKEYLIETKSSTRKSKGRTFKSKGVVISGGVLGTLQLLFRQKYHYKTLPFLSDTLGQNILSNSESISGVIGTDRKLNHGIAISSLIQADENTQIELCKFPNGSGSLFRLAFIAAGGIRPWKRALQVCVNVLTHPINTLKWIFYGHRAESALIVLVMQTLKNALTMKWNGKKMTLQNGSQTPIPVYIPSGDEVMRRLAKKTNGVAVNALTETFLNMSTTAHILGGCPMGEAVSQGVVDENFRVHGYENMFILDGSIVPANIGVNPSLTITALAEYAMDQIMPYKDRQSN